MPNVAGAPPPPPPPPPLPGMPRFGAQKGGPTMGLSDVLAGRAKLRKNTSESPASPTTRSPIGGPGGPPPPPPPAPGVPRAPTLKTPVDAAQRKLKTFQWDKVSPHGLASTIWGQQGNEDDDIAAKLRRQGIFDLMEEDFRAKQTVKLASKREKTTLTTCLGTQQGQNIGMSVSVDWFATC